MYRILKRILDIAFALWNQYDLIAKRDKYIGQNDLTPNDVRPRLDEDHIKNFGFPLDCRCFFGTTKSLLLRDGTVESGTDCKGGIPCA